MSIIKDIDYIEFYVSNACDIADFYSDVFGFDVIAYGNKETGLNNKTSYLLNQKNILLMFTSSDDKKHPISKHQSIHGNGVKDIAFLVDVPLPSLHKDIRTINVFGDTTHTFRSISIRQSIFESCLTPITPPVNGGKLQKLNTIDHLSVCVPRGKMEYLTKYYQDVFHFNLIFSENIRTKYSGMNSTVVANENRTVKIPIVEPVLSKKLSQVDEFLKSYKSAGIQHLAFATDDIIGAVKEFSRKGVVFLDVPDAYYETQATTYPEFSKLIEQIRPLQILIDVVEDGYLMQIFTKPIFARPTFFIEIIQRENTDSFGSGNVRALFDAIEREQINRAG